MNTVKSSIFQIIRRKESLLFLVFVIAGVSLFGWIFDSIIVTSFSLKYIPIAPATVLIFIALCILFLTNINPKVTQLTKSTVTIFLIIIVFFCGLIFLNHVFNFKWDVENLINHKKFGNGLAGHMSPITAMLFTLICISFFCIGQNNSKIIKYIGGSLSLFVCLIASVLLIGYLYKAPLLYGSAIIPVALPTAICFLLYSITMLRVIELKFWTFNLIKDNIVALQLLKSFLPIGIFIIILQGYLITNFSFISTSPTLFVALTLFIAIMVTFLLIFRVSTIIGIKLMRAEKSLKESERKLFQLNNDKDLFISILAHDLKSPFNSLLGLSEVLTEEISKLNPEEIESYAININKSARNTYNLLEDILMWARVQQGKIPFNPQNLSFADVCNDILKTLNPGANIKNITIHYPEPDHVSVFADADMLKTVLRNLVSNAIKFTNIDGTIYITAKQIDSNMTISVSDNGIGISPHNLTKLFDMSEVISTTGTAEETGTGLGLLLCKEFVEKHGGKIWVESVDGNGSDFKFTLPIYNEMTNSIIN